MNVFDGCYQIALFAVHSTWLRCTSVYICVMITVLEFVHVCTGTYGVNVGMYSTCVYECTVIINHYIE